jgi:hypothetical protein
VSPEDEESESVDEDGDEAAGDSPGDDEPLVEDVFATDYPTADDI